VINPHLYKEMAIDPLKDLAPVASLVSNGFSSRSIRRFPRKTSPSSSNTRVAPIRRCSTARAATAASTSHHGAPQGSRRNQHGPRAVKGGAPATTATVAGEVAAMMSGTSTAGQIRAGRLRAIAFTGPQRSRVLPGVPAIAEFYPDFVMVQWYGLFAPAGTPDAVIARLRAETNKMLALPDLKEKLSNAGGVESWITSPEEFAAQIRSEYATYGKLVKQVGAKID